MGRVLLDNGGNRRFLPFRLNQIRTKLDQNENHRKRIPFSSIFQGNAARPVQSRRFGGSL